MLVLQSFSMYCAHYFLVCKSFLQIVFLSNIHVHCVCDSHEPLTSTIPDGLERSNFKCQFSNWRSGWKQHISLRELLDGSLLVAPFFFFIPLTSLKFCLTSFRLQVPNKLQPYFVRGSVLRISVDSIFSNHITIPSLGHFVQASGTVHEESLK